MTESISLKNLASGLSKQQTEEIISIEGSFKQMLARKTRIMNEFEYVSCNIDDLESPPAKLNELRP